MSKGNKISDITKELLSNGALPRKWNVPYNQLCEHNGRNVLEQDKLNCHIYIYI